jgi:hypothetical protein
MTAPRESPAGQVPWPGEITKEFPPRRAIAAWKDASVRRLGFEEQKAEDLAGERLAAPVSSADDRRA